MFQISVKPEEIEKLNLAAFEGKITVIDNEGPEFDRAISYLGRQKVIGFDTETRPSFTNSQPRSGVALLQLSGAREAFLFRIKHLGMHERLCRILSSEKIIKVGAAVHDDVKGLQKYRDFDAKGFKDLQKMVWEYGIKDKSVKKMAAIILGVKISKTQQLSNWEAEVLSASQMLYAATDAWVCREMYNLLMKSEKNPLTPEQMLPQTPAPKPKAPKQEQNGSGQENSNSESGNNDGAEDRKKRRRKKYNQRRRYYQNKRRRRNKNKNTNKGIDNGKDNTEKR